MIFDALVLSLPARHSTLRVRAWRTLKETGCGVLRDGVYVLPKDSKGSSVLSRLESEINAAGGSAMVVELEPKSPDDLKKVRALFDRTADYRALLQKLSAPATPRVLERLRRAFARLSAIDFFPGTAKRQAAEALSALERRLEDARGEPHSSLRHLRPLDRKTYQNRVWATRKKLWVDRMASAWLIRRFIDPSARFVWIDGPRDRPKKAVGFDFDGAQFTHVDGRVTFEVLLAGFGLEGDAALATIGRAVHFLDVGGTPVPDAKGLETMLRGAKEKARSDDALLADAMRTFDNFYSAYASQAEPRR